MAAPLGNQYALGNDGGRPLKFPDPQDFARQIDAYIKHADDNKEAITIYHCAKFMGCDDETLVNYKERGEVYAAALKKLATAGCASLIDRGMEAKNPALFIYLMKVLHGLIETINENITVTTLADVKSIRANREQKVLPAVDIEAKLIDQTREPAELLDY